jgi:hypothetical protein
VCTNAASRARDGDPRFAPVALAGYTAAHTLGDVPMLLRPWFQEPFPCQAIIIWWLDIERQVNVKKRWVHLKPYQRPQLQFPAKSTFPRERRRMRMQSV